MPAQNSMEIKMFLVDGKATGMVTARIVHHPVRVVIGPRLDLGKMLKRNEADRTGVYFIVGEADSGGLGVYIGQGRSIRSRLPTSVSKFDKPKTFWDWQRVCFITSGEDFTNTHALYAESELINLAQKAGRAKMMTSKTPKKPVLPEADIVSMNKFIEQIEIILPSLGLDFLRPTRVSEIISPSAEEDGQDVDNVEFEINNRSLSVQAFMVIRGNEFFVKKGSQGRVYRGMDVPDSEIYVQKQDALIKSKKLDKRNEGDKEIIIFKEDVPFTSPSTAARIVLGVVANGRVEWKIKGTKTTYGEWLKAKTNAN